MTFSAVASTPATTVHAAATMPPASTAVATATARPTTAGTTRREAATEVRLDEELSIKK
jgi:hypothetical protein